MIDYYRGLRHDVSLLLAEGHTHARRYPLAKVWAEADIVKRRKNDDLATHMVVLQAAVGSVLSGPKHFNEVLKRLQDG